MKGYVYLVQPAEFKNTSCFKIGMSCRSNDRRLKRYGNGLKIIQTHDCSNPTEVEDKLKAEFKSKFTLTRGLEYFTGDLDDMIECFNTCIEQVSIECMELKLNISDIIESLRPYINSKTKFADMVIQCNQLIPDFLSYNQEIFRRITFWLCQPKLSTKTIVANIELVQIGLFKAMIRPNQRCEFAKTSGLQACLDDNKICYRPYDAKCVPIINKARGISEWCKNSLSIDEYIVPLLNDILPPTNGANRKNHTREFLYISGIGLLQTIIAFKATKCSDFTLKIYASLMLELLAMYNDEMTN